MEPQLKLQILLYPVVQSINFNGRSYTEYEYDTLLARDIMVAMWLCYAQGKILCRFEIGPLLIHVYIFFHKRNFVDLDLFNCM